jgi:DNA (cytosine-5)-methyltransferase 3A
MAIKVLMGGSPCTYWSIAQTNNRETKAEGMGWELFKNYLIAKEKFKPDFFLYENNKSAAQAIKDQIAEEFGVGVDPDVRFTYINSALVSAQNRQRFYVTNFGDIDQPEDRGILLKDILETGNTDREKAHAVISSVGRTTTREYFDKQPGTMAFEPVYIGEVPEHKGTYRNGKQPSQQYRIYDTNAKGVAVTTAAITNVAEPIPGYATPCEWDENGIPTKAISFADGKTYAVYEVKDGQITIKGKTHHLNLPDGYYIIRKLTVTECARLQTMPDDYCKAVSDSQAYKALGNGWTAEAIIHLLNHALKDVPRDEEIVVLSMYDGIATGRYCLDKMGFTNVTYHAYEIDKYPIQVAMDNYPDIIQHGDAFAVREDDWKPPQTRSEWLKELLET